MELTKPIEQRYPIWNGLTDREKGRLEALDECRRICRRQVGSACYAYVDAIECEIDQLIGEIAPTYDDPAA